MTFAQRRISQDVSPLLSDAYLYYTRYVNGKTEYWHKW